MGLGPVGPWWGTVRPRLGPGGSDGTRWGPVGPVECLTPGKFWGSSGEAVDQASLILTLL